MWRGVCWKRTTDLSPPYSESRVAALLGLRDPEDEGNIILRISVTVYQTTWRNIPTSAVRTSHFARVLGRKNWDCSAFETSVLLINQHDVSPQMTWIFKQKFACPNRHVGTVSIQCIVQQWTGTYFGNLIGPVLFICPFGVNFFFLPELQPEIYENNDYTKVDFGLVI